MGTQIVNLDLTQYVQVTTEPGVNFLQSHGDMVRIAFSDLKPAKSNTAFHELGGNTSFGLSIPHTEIPVWALAMTNSSKLTVTKLNDTIPVNITDPTEPNGSVSVTIQDQTTPLVIVPLHQLKYASELAADALIDEYTIEVDDTTGFTDGSLIAISDVNNDQVYFGKQVGAPVDNTVTLDRPLDFTYIAGLYVTTNTDDLAVDGSVTTQTFGLRQGVPDGLEITVDITRVLPVIYTASTPTLSDFGDISGGITHGVTLRKRDGNRVNIFNAKDNGDFAAFAYDLRFLSSIGLGQDGLHGRLTFGGQSKMGAVVRISPEEDLEMIVNDDLSSLEKFNLVAEGSVVIT